MKKKLMSIVAIYVVAGLLALDLHADDGEEMVSPPQDLDAPLVTPGGAEETREVPPPRPEMRAEESPAPRRAQPRAEEAPRTQERRWQDAVFACGQAVEGTIGTNQIDGWTLCTAKINGRGAGKKYWVRVNKIGLELHGLNGRVFWIRHRSDRALTGNYFGGGLDLSWGAGISIGSFEQERGTARLSFFGGKFLGGGFSVTTSVQIREYRERSRSTYNIRN